MPTEQEWAILKPTIIDLYITRGKTVTQVADEMAHEYQFKAT